MELLVQYVRWSTSEQDSGDSLRRQNSMFDNFYKKHSHKFYTSPTHRYVDKGKSGFHQKHKTDGEFKRMFDNVMNGTIKAGSVIACEGFDRMSRADIDDAVEDVRQILRKGVEIITLSDNETYDKSSLSDPFKLIKHILIAQRAHEESLVKQQRTLEVWSAKTKEAKLSKKPLGKQAPGWLELNEERTAFYIIPDKAELVREIFKKRLSGMSMFAVTKWLNESGKPPINDRKVRISKTAKPGGGNWSALSVKCLLTSRATIGYLPAKISKEDYKTVLREEIPDYYPRIVDDQTFYAVQQLLSETGKGRITKGEHWLYTNIFRTIIRCACGLTMQPSGIRKPNYQGTYRCNGMAEKRCPYGAVSRKTLDTELCTRLFSKLSQLYDEHVDATRLEELQRDIQRIDDELAKLTETLIALPNITQIRDALDAKQKEKDSVLFELKREKARVDSVVDMDLSKLNFETVEGRTEAHIIIKKLVREIVVNGRDKLVDVYLHNGNVIEGFSLEGKSDHTLSFTEATDEEKHREVMDIIGQNLPAVYKVTEEESDGGIVDDREFPDVEPEDGYLPEEGK
ncbi:recombinase family protein [Klebsiella michiganensis]|uniref:recombinase family protein n=1 Tax=Klebsiella michiganensis TaxID=1134687 RepID=UPI0039708C88